MPLPSTQKPMAVFSARRVRLPQPKASLDPSANPMVDAIPTAARIEPLRPCTNAGRFDTILGAVISPMEPRAKQSAADRRHAPGARQLDRDIGRPQQFVDAGIHAEDELEDGEQTHDADRSRARDDHPARASACGHEQREPAQHETRGGVARHRRQVWQELDERGGMREPAGQHRHAQGDAEDRRARCHTRRPVS